MLASDGAGYPAGKPVVMASRELHTLSQPCCTAVPGIRSSGVGLGSLSCSVLQYRSYSDDGRVPPNSSAVLDPLSGEFSPAVPTARTFGAHRAVYHRNAYPLRKCEGLRVYRPIVKLGRTAWNEEERRVVRNCIRASGNVGQESSCHEVGDDVDSEEKVGLDSSVFEEVYPSVIKVVKRVGERVRGVPVPESTLVPDDWKEMQQYLHRGKKERKQETLARQLEWAKRRALEERLTQQENERLRGQSLASFVGGAQAENLDGGVGSPSTVVSGRATPKDFRAELPLCHVEEIAQSLGRDDEEEEEEEEESSSEVDNDEPAREREMDSEDAAAPAAAAAGNEKHLLTAEERAMLKNKTLNFARVSSSMWSPLHTLAAAGQVYLAAELLKRRAVDLELADRDGLRPLHRAVQAGRKAVVRMLVKAGADAQVLDSHGATLLHYAARNGDQDISKLLLRNGVDVNAADADGWTPLHVAVQSGRLELVKTLVHRGADVNLVNKDGNTALDLALAFGGCFNFYDAIKFLKKMSDLDGREL